MSGAACRGPPVAVLVDGLLAPLVAALHLLDRVQPLLVPGFQNGVTIGPLHGSGVETRLFVGHGNDIVAKAPVQPLADILLLGPGQPPVSQLEALLDPGYDRLLLQLSLHIKGCIFQGVNALVGPVVRFFFNGPQRRRPNKPSGPAALNAVCNQYADDLCGQPQVVVEGQQNFQLLRGQHPAQTPLGLTHQQTKAVAPFCGPQDVGLRVYRRLIPDDGPLTGVLQQTQLPQRGHGSVHPVGGPAEGFGGSGRLRAAAEIQVQQRPVTRARAQQAAYLREGQGQDRFIHGARLLSDKMGKISYLKL